MGFRRRGKEKGKRRVMGSARIEASNFVGILQTAVLVQGSKFSPHEGVNFTRRLYETKTDVSLVDCTFCNCTVANLRGGGACMKSCNCSIDHCRFEHCAAHASGALEVTNCPAVAINQSVFHSNTAFRYGAGQLDGKDPTSTLLLKDTNFTGNRAQRWIGALRLQHHNGTIEHCNFHDNSAHCFGTIFDFNTTPSSQLICFTTFTNNSAVEKSAAIDTFHILYTGTITDCLFMDSSSGTEEGQSILIESDLAAVAITNCQFSGTREQEIAVVHSTAKLTEHGNHFMEKHLM